MTETKNGAKYIDRDPPMEGNDVNFTPTERKIVDYLAYLKESLNFVFTNQGKRLTDADGNLNEIRRTAEYTESYIASARGSYSSLMQMADSITAGTFDPSGIESQITVQAGRITQEVTDRTNADNALQSSITTQAGQISLVVERLGNLGGRNLVKGTGTSKTLTVDSDLSSQYTTAWYFSDFGQNLFSGNTDDKLTVSFDYTTTGATASGSTTPDIYPRVNGAAGNAQSHTVQANETGHYKSSYILTSAQATYANSFRVTVRLRNAAEGATLTVSNLKIEYGESQTTWTPAPEDMVGNDEIITKINLTPESATIQASKISLYGKTIALTSDNINISSTNFSVDTDGNITAKGGTIGGWDITDTMIGKGSTYGGSTYYARMQAPSGDDFNPGSWSAFYIRKETGNTVTYPFRVRYDGTLEATNAHITGEVTATSGSIAGSLVTSGISAANITAGTLSVARLSAGSIKSAKLDMSEIFSQNITATNMNITGGSVSITTASDSDNKIVLSGPFTTNHISPGGMTSTYTSGNTTELVSVGPGEVRITSSSSSAGALVLSPDNISTAYGNLAKTGMYYTKSASTTTTSGTVMTVHSQSLAAGRWLLIGQVSFPASGTGYRRIAITTATNTTEGFRASMAGINGTAAVLNVCGFVALSSATTYNLNVYQNTGSGVTAEYEFRAIRIA